MPDSASTPDPSRGPTPAPTPPDDSLLGRLDAWMADNPWHPRATPFFVYMIGMLVIQMLTTGAFGLPELVVIRPALYTIQIALVLWLLWRYRKLIPELNIKFHWLAIPTGVGLLFAWVILGYFTNWLSHSLQGTPILGDLFAWRVPTDPQTDHGLSQTDKHWMNDQRDTLGGLWFWSAMILRFIGMTVAVPLFEELWVRSAVLRGMFDPRKTWTAILQLASDMPIIGEPISQTKAAQRAAQQPPMFTQQLQEQRVGQITLFAVFMSTLIFMLAHQPRDYLGCIACGLVWCWLVWITNKPRQGETWADQPSQGRYGLGPIVWSHGITNALLWAFTLYTNDWQFL